MGHSQGGRQAGLVPLAQGRQAGAATGRPRRSRCRDRHRRRARRTVHRCCGRCCSPSPTKSSARQRNPTMCCRTATCAGREVDLPTVRDTKSYLAQLVTRQALNALRAGARRREDYVGPWLPEPLLLDEQDPSADVVLAESVSMAMLVLLETLESRRARGVRAARGVRLRLRRNRLGGRQIRADGASDRAPRPRARAGPAQAVRPRSTREQYDPDHRGVHGRGGRRRCAGGDVDAGPRRGVDRRQRRQGQRGAPPGGRRRQGGPGSSSG